MVISTGAARKALLAASVASAAAASWVGSTGAAAAGPAGDPTVIDGTYRVVITDADLERNDVARAHAILENHGIQTWTLRRGRWHLHQVAPNHLFHPDVAGTYAVKGDRVHFTFAGTGAPLPATFRWRLVGRELRFTAVGQVNSVVNAFFTAHPWKKL